MRKALGLVQGKKKEFHKKEVTEEAVKEEKHLHVPLVTAERAWAYYMQLKFEANSDPRKKFHMVNRLRKAAKHAEALSAVCGDSSKVPSVIKIYRLAYKDEDLVTGGCKDQVGNRCLFCLDIWNPPL